MPFSVTPSPTGDSPPLSTPKDRAVAAAAGGDKPDGARPEVAAGQKIGPYIIVGEHSKGGQGRIILAKDESLGRYVAIKTLRPGRESDEAQLRLQNEARFITRLEHVGIVPVYYSGNVDERESFFAMRFIGDRTLHDAIQTHHRSDRTLVSLRGLLQDFLLICNVIQYAHSKRVLHLDLKPVNVGLGGPGEVWVLDWGLADVLMVATPSGPDDSGASIASRASAGGTDSDVSTGAPTAGDHGMPVRQRGLLGTPHYMAPEQADPQRHTEIGTATDLYGLGAILREILTGRPPYEGDDHARILSEVLRGPPKAVTDIVPTPPSGLTRERYKSLAAICNMAMRPTVAERYASAEEVAHDVRQWLEDEPVRAYRDRFRTRAARWGMKHRAIVTVFGVAMVISFVSLLGVVIVQARANTRIGHAKNAADRSAARANNVTAFWTEKVLSQALPENSPVGDRISLRQVLDQAAAQLDWSGTLADEPGDKAAVYLTIGKAYRKLGFLKQAESYLRTALDVCAGQLGPDDPLTLFAEDEVAQLMLSQGQAKNGEAGEFIQGMVARRQALGTMRRDTLKATSLYAKWLLQNHRYPESEKLYRQNLKDRQEVLGDEDEDALVATEYLAVALERQKKYGDAAAFHRSAWKRFCKARGRSNPDALAIEANLVGVIQQQGKLDECREHYEFLVKELPRIAGKDSQKTQSALNNYALWLMEIGEWTEAEKVCRDVLSAKERRLGKDHENTLKSVCNLAKALHARGATAEAATLLEQARASIGRPLPAISDTALAIESYLAAVRQLQGRHGDAEPILTRLVTVHGARLKVGDPDLLFIQVLLAGTLSANGETGRARDLVQTTLINCPETLPKYPWLNAYAESILGACMVADGKHAEAEATLLEAYRKLKAARSTPPCRLEEALDKVVVLYERWGKREAAGRFKEELSRAKQGRSGSGRGR